MKSWKKGLHHFSKQVFSYLNGTIIIMFEGQMKSIVAGRNNIAAFTMGTWLPVPMLQLQMLSPKNKQKFDNKNRVIWYHIHLFRYRWNRLNNLKLCLINFMLHFKRTMLSWFQVKGSISIFMTVKVQYYVWSYSIISKSCMSV